MSRIEIRDTKPTDFSEIKRLNDEFVHFTSPMDMARIAQLDELGFYHKVICEDGIVLGFLLAMTDDCVYDSDNYRWFNQRFNQFAYIDRVVIDTLHHGRRLGQQLYKNLFEFAQQKDINTVCCEYNLVPANPNSAIFHMQLGFKEVHRLSSNDVDKLVSMQAKELTINT